MAFHLKRKRDNKLIHGNFSNIIKWNDDNTYKESIGFLPTIGMSVMVGYSFTSHWLTTLVTEILEEIKNDQVHYIRFKTKNSEYEWWNGVHPYEKED